MVVATQNPYEFEGTYFLPENQLDRFLMRISLGYPAPDDESRDHPEAAGPHDADAAAAGDDRRRVLRLQERVDR